MVIEALHVGGSAWSFLPVKNSLGGVWHNIVQVINRPVVGSRRFRDYFRGSVGRGDGILFWLDPWLKDVPLKDVFPMLFSLEVVKTCSVEDRLRGEFLWKHDPELPSELTELAALNVAVAQVSLSDRKDDWKWLPDKAGIFSVKSAKQLLETVDNSNSGFVLQWCKWVPIKCNAFVWRAGLNRIPTIDSLRRRGIGVGDALCPLCKSVDESVEHLFTSCVIASILWQKVSRWCRIPPIFAFSFKDLVEIHNGPAIIPRVKHIIHGIIFVSCWVLWAARNKVVFSGMEVKVDSLFGEVRSLDLSNFMVDI
ncbi:uncharacterized protein LOC110907604 [Helianthus annuus]|uniref:uncharacterized protein LOC110907604 n=1 Tax=Helianthus annuus TaxID=4232 RepID=UPI0016531396|nr:uncharacterized protein LOC110907604 [Helianthus annuus]